MTRGQAPGRVPRGPALSLLDLTGDQAPDASGPDGAPARPAYLRRPRIVAAHVLRNSLVPVLAAVGPLLGYLVTGSFVIELVFNVPGIGRYFVAGVLARDYPLVLGLTTVLALAIVTANLLVDLAHAALDPRVRDAAARA